MRSSQAEMTANCGNNCDRTSTLQFTRKTKITKFNPSRFSLLLIACFLVSLSICVGAVVENKKLLKSTEISRGLCAVAENERGF